MPKRIVFCADGTWQAPMNNTNVYRLYKALTVSSDQVPLYDDGVGADASGITRIIEGALGQSLVDKVQEAYKRIAHLYEAGDQIYLFGFSRGAYTARSLAGMIAGCGLPTGSFDDSCATQVFNAYRDPANRKAMLAQVNGCTLGDATIQMVGVWDTVGSLGIPALQGAVDQQRFGFLDTKLHPDVKSAYHCLAIDEVRTQFPATLWTGDPVAGQTIEQVWFSGCHGDVGGGTLVGGPVDAGTRLCDITFSWMAQKAQEQGLVFDPAVAQQFTKLPAKFALDVIRQSWKPEMGPQHLRPIADDAHVANSVAVRVKFALTYLPGDLTITNGELDPSYTLVEVVDEDAF